MITKCEHCGTTINPVANTHYCQPTGSTLNFEVKVGCAKCGKPALKQVCRVGRDGLAIYEDFCQEHFDKNKKHNRDSCDVAGCKNCTYEKQKCPHGDKTEQMKENNGAHCLCSTNGECLHNPVGNHCRLLNCPYPHDVCTSDKCPVCLEKKPGALTPLGELVKAIQDFRNKMAQDKCYGHCKTYQDEIQKLSDFFKQICK